MISWMKRRITRARARCQQPTPADSSPHDEPCAPHEQTEAAAPAESAPQIARPQSQRESKTRFALEL